jgi:MFS family permease
MTTAVATPVAAPPQPAEAPLGNLRHTALSAFWFGMNFLWLPLTTILVAGQVDQVVPKGSQNAAIGFAIGIGGFFSVTIPPLVGAWSDRMNSRFGRRRPIIVAGTLLTMPGLFLLMTATNYPQIIIGLVIVQIFFNGAGAAYAGVIPDVVPAQEFGKASGFLATMTQLGIGAGLGVTFLFTPKDATAQVSPAIYPVFAIVVLLTLIPMLWAAQGEGATPVPKPTRRPLSETIREFVRPLHEGDFAWVIFTRLMISAGITVVLYNLVNFFRDVVLQGTAQSPQGFTTIWEGITIATAIPFGFFGGWFSDRLHKRKVFVYISGVAQGLVAVVFIVFYPTSVPLVLLLGVAYGIGYGLYYAVDWALACDTLPDKKKSAKDMGIFHIALTLPQAIVPFFAGPLIDALNGPHGNGGYRIVFSTAIVFLALGTVFVSRIKTVR